MHHIEVLHELWGRLLEDIPGVHVYIRRQPGLRTDLIQTDIEAVQVNGLWLVTGEVMEPDAVDT